VTSRSAEFVTLLATLPSERARLNAGLPELQALYRDCIRRAAPPNPQFERERIIAQAPNPRELAFLFGLLNEGENEAALLLELVDSVHAADPRAPVEHIADEAWYYLRTSIDPEWQLDTAGPSLAAALAYLFIVLDQRRDALAALPVPAEPERDDAPARTGLLRSLRDELG
jgi:hypothetical protein